MSFVMYETEKFTLKTAVCVGVDVTYVFISIEKSIRLETSGCKGVKTSVENEMEG